MNFHLSHQFTIDPFLGRAENLDWASFLVGVDNLIDRSSIGSGIIIGCHGTLIIGGTTRYQSEEYSGEGNWFYHSSEWFEWLKMYKLAYLRANTRGFVLLTLFRAMPWSNEKLLISLIGFPRRMDLR